jgi:hypothetical protein
LFCPEAVDVCAEGVGGDLAAASDVDGFDLAGVEEFVEFGPADAECMGGLGDGVEERGVRQCSRGDLLLLGWLSGGFVRADVRGRCVATRAGARDGTSARMGGLCVAAGAGVGVVGGGSPAASGDLCDGAVGGVLLESLVDPCAAHSGDLDEQGDGETFGRRLAERCQEGLFGVRVR